MSDYSDSESDSSNSSNSSEVDIIKPSKLDIPKSKIDIGKINILNFVNSCKPTNYINNEITEMNLPWTEKYRPSDFSGFIAHEYILFILKNFINNNNLPNLIFFGPSGTGKTSLAKICASKLYTDNYEFMVLSVNASEERGIDLIRIKIKTFASNKTQMHKFIILDEADSMTYDAQFMLFDIMDTFISSVRFCIICNNIQKIIPHIRSRCMQLYFSKLSNTDIFYKLNLINNTITQEISDTFNKIYDGDLRKIINSMQSISFIHKNISTQHIYSFASYPTSNLIVELKNTLLSTLSIDNKFIFIKNSTKFINFIHIIYELFNILDYTICKNLSLFVFHLNKLIIDINSSYQIAYNHHIYSLISLVILYY